MPIKGNILEMDFIIHMLGKRKQRLEEDLPEWKKRKVSELKNDEMEDVGGLSPPRETDDVPILDTEEIPVIHARARKTLGVKRAREKSPEYETRPSKTRKIEEKPPNSPVAEETMEEQTEDFPVDYEEPTSYQNPFEPRDMEDEEEILSSNTSFSDGEDIDSEPEEDDFTHDSKLVSSHISLVIKFLDKMLGAVGKCEKLLARTSPAHHDSYAPLSKALVASKERFYNLKNINTGEKLVLATGSVKHFWSETESGDTSILLPTDNMLRFYREFCSVTTILENKIQRDWDSINLFFDDFKNFLRFISVSMNDATVTKAAYKSINLITAKQESSLKKAQAGINKNSPDIVIEAFMNLKSLKSSFDKNVPGLCKILKEKTGVKSTEILFDLEYSYIGENNKMERMFKRIGVSYYKTAAKKYFINEQSSGTKVVATKNILDPFMINYIIEKYDFMSTSHFMNTTLSMIEIYRKAEGVYERTLPEVITEEEAAKYSIVPLSKQEINTLANYGIPLEKEIESSETFYANYPPPTSDNGQEIEPGIEVSIMGNPIPKMDLIMGVVMRDLPENDLEMAVHETNGLVIDRFRISEDQWVMSLDMKKAPKNHYREVYEGSDVLYSKTFQWFITVNPNMTNQNLAKAPSTPMKVKDFTEYYESVRKAFSTYIQGWLYYGANPILDTEVRAWKMDVCRKERGGGNNRIAHMHFLITVEIISLEEIDSKLVNISYTRIRTYLQKLWKNSYFNSQKVNIEKNGKVDPQKDTEKITAYITKGDKLSAQGEIKYISKR